MDFIKETVGYDEWTIYLIDADDDVLGLDADAEVLFEKKEIYFRRNELRLNVVLHELWHVYFGYCYLSDASLDMHQCEEISSSLFADRGEGIVIKGKDIYNKLKSLRDGV